jgi:hypothetical protein
MHASVVLQSLSLEVNIRYYILNILKHSAVYTKFSSYLTEKILRLYYKYRSADVVQGGKYHFLTKQTHCMRKDAEFLNVTARWWTGTVNGQI